MKALVTGATGYIGSQLVGRLVTDGWDVAIVARPESDLSTLQALDHGIEVIFYDGIFATFAAQVSGPFDAIFHLATCYIARHKSDDINQLIASNVTFGTHVLEAAVASSSQPVPFISTSSASQYSGAAYTPSSLYAATKQAFEDIVTFYSISHGVSAQTLRLPDTYGPNDKRKKILNLIAEHTENRIALDMSGGEQEFDVLHVNDVVEGLLIAANRAQQNESIHEVHSLSSLNPLPLRSIIERFEKATGESCPVRWGALPYRDQEIMKITIPNDVLPGWTPKISLDDGLKCLIDTDH